MTDFRFPSVPAPGAGVDWDTIVSAFDWAKKLGSTPQNSTYHAEGDVGTHTRMVLEALIGLDAWKTLPETEREIAFWAALLHDVAKPVCTRIDANGKIRSPNHTLAGECMAREIMYRGIPEPVPFACREQIAKLVRFHGLPRWLLDGSNSTKKMIRASLQARLDLVALLAEADARGRISDDTAENLERVDLFRQFAAETGCYDSAYPFDSSLARITYLNSNGGSPAYVPFDSTWGEVLLMSGLPGAGKDTWIRDHARNLPMVSLDAIRKELNVGPDQNQGRVIQAAKSKARAFLRQKTPFVWNATNVTGHLRRPLIDLFHSYGAKVRIVYVETAYQELLLRNQHRRESVPKVVLDRLIHKLDVPSVVEAEVVDVRVD